MTATNTQPFSQTGLCLQTRWLCIYEVTGCGFAVTSDMAHASSKFLDTQENYGVQIHSETCTCMIITYRQKYFLYRKWGMFGTTTSDQSTLQ